MVGAQILDPVTSTDSEKGVYPKFRVEWVGGWVGGVGVVLGGSCDLWCSLLVCWGRCCVARPSGHTHKTFYIGKGKDERLLSTLRR